MLKVVVVPAPVDVKVDHDEYEGPAATEYR
jgi:hypothetical protein